MRKAPNMSMYRQPDDGRLPSRISVGAETGHPRTSFAASWLAIRGLTTRCSPRCRA